MMNDLHHIAIGIRTVKTARAIPVGARLRVNAHALGLQERMPGIDVRRIRHDEADVIEALITPGIKARFGAMQCQIVIARREIDVVRIGPPFHGHAQQLAIKALAGLEIDHIERHVAQPGSLAGTLHRAHRVSTPGNAAPVNP